MSLIIARQVDGEIYIVGDTKVTDEARSWKGDKSEREKHIGYLKVVLLAPGLCVGFSGDPEVARDAIEGIYDKNINLFDKNITIDHFLKFHRASIARGNSTDFIVASIVECHDQPGAFEKELFRIADSNVYVEKVPAHIHIGNDDAFNKFQEAFHGANQTTPVPTFEISRLGNKERPNFDRSLSSAMHAMQCVIEDVDISNVGGIRTVIVSEDDQFRYVEYIQVKGIPTPVRNEPGSPIRFGAAAEGSDIRHIGMFSAVGHDIFPVYFNTGQFGVIYHPKMSFEPQIEPNCTLDEFRLKVEDRIKVAHQRALGYQSRF